LTGWRLGQPRRDAVHRQNTPACHIGTPSLSVGCRLSLIRSKSTCPTSDCQIRRVFTVAGLRSNVIEFTTVRPARNCRNVEKLSSFGNVKHFRLRRNPLTSPSCRSMQLQGVITVRLVGHRPFRAGRKLTDVRPDRDPSLSHITPEKELN